jgi:uncharacterized NAD(P)/FAD-binding protein YdhS
MPSKTSPRKVDVAIIGSGTSAVAVAAQIVNKTDPNNGIRSIVLIEKGNGVGTGLAYSSACQGTNVNGHPSTMGVFARDPEGFFRWLREQGQDCTGSVPSRESFGEYLQYQLEQTIHAADRLGIMVRIVNDEAVDVRRLDNRFEVILKDSDPIMARQVVLAIGDFSKLIYPEMALFPGYIGTPWPLTKLDCIPPDAPVAVVGTSLTAIDITLRLAENGHRGKIYLFSRHGRLPKVKGKATTLSVFRNQYILRKLARDLEQDTSNAFDTITRTIAAELVKIECLHRFSLQSVAEPIKELESGIADAIDGNVGWLAILHATASVLERYWNCLSLEEQKIFNEKYTSTWYTYRNAMPLQNAKSIYALMHTGQLEVLSAPRATWNGSSFVVPTQKGNISTSFLVEAAGMEYDPRLIDSTLLHRLLDSKLLRPHAAGGVSVDFWTLEATKNLFAIGSLTRGVHFYTNSVRRIAAHAERVADTIVGNSVCRPQHVAIFPGSLNAFFNIIPMIVPHFLSNDHFPFVFLTQPIVESLHMVEKDGSGFQHKVIVSDLQDRYGIFVIETNMASPALVETLKSHHIDIGFGIDMKVGLPREVSHYFQSPRAFVEVSDVRNPAATGPLTA